MSGDSSEPNLWFKSFNFLFTNRGAFVRMKKQTNSLHFLRLNAADFLAYLDKSSFIRIRLEYPIVIIQSNTILDKLSVTVCYIKIENLGQLTSLIHAGLFVILDCKNLTK